MQQGFVPARTGSRKESHPCTPLSPGTTGLVETALQDDRPAACDLKEFAASGKKAYSYIAVSGKSDTKHKGVTITSRNAEVINFDGIKKMAIDSDHKVGTSKLLFERTPHGMRTRTTVKDCKNTVTTRAVVDGVYTLPFGHKELHQFSF